MGQYLFASALRTSIFLNGFITGVTTAAVVWSSPVLAVAIATWNFDQDTRQLQVTLPQGVIPRYLVLAEPARIVLEIPNVQAGDLQIDNAYDGQISHIRSAQHSADTVHIVLELAPGTRLDPRHAQLSSAPINGQVRWTLTPLLVDSAAAAQARAAANPPQLQTAEPPAAAAPSPQVPATASVSDSPDSGPRLSTSASNLMLPTIGDDLADLPQVLPIDPFSTSFDSDARVSVPDLEETVGDAVVAAEPPAPSSDSVASGNVASTDGNVSGDTVNGGTGRATPLQTVNPPENNDETAVATEPAGVIASPPPTAAGAGGPEEPTAEAPLAVAPPTSQPQYDPVAVEPPASVPSLPTAPASQPQPAAPLPEPPQVIASEPAVPETSMPEPPSISAANSTRLPEPPPITSAPPTDPPMPAMAAEQPPESLASQPPTGVITTPPVPTASAAVPSPPEAPESAVTITLPPPGNNTPADQEVIIAFGQPLPNATGKALGVDMGNPDDPVPTLTDVLLPAGTLLNLRYPGDAAITVDQQATGQETLVLEEDLRDGANRLVAPAGSRMVGHFEPTPTGQRWVSDALVLSGGQVALATRSDYLASAPEVSTGSLAMNSGIGALAVAVLTGFSGFGLLGGAVIGATTAVGTAPQTITIQPGEIIQVQVLEDVTYAALDWSNPQPVGEELGN